MPNDKPDKSPAEPTDTHQFSDGRHLYQPSVVEASRMREQGLGVGAHDLDNQADATRARTPREYRERTETAAHVEAADRDQRDPRPKDRRQ